MNKKAVFIAATGQHVGKTTTCLGLISGLQKRDERVGFMKPVGQEYIEIETGIHIDKDVILFKNHFRLRDHYKHMSPVLFPRGFTRDYLDGKVDRKDLQEQIVKSYVSIRTQNSFVIVEGTGHIGVGSIVGLNNAQIASLLNLNVILVASGGLGSSFDKLMLNKTQCDFYGVTVTGVILNRVHQEKRKMIIDYMTKALKSLDIPLLGCIPYDVFLSTPTMRDFEQLFDSKLISGEEYLYRHFQHNRLVATSVDNYRNLVIPSQLIITPASREDIILTTLSKYWDMQVSSPKKDLEAGIILTGSTPPNPQIVEQLKKAHIPMIYTPVSSYTAMKMITSFTAKIRAEDVEKIDGAVELVENHIDFETLVSLCGE